jgi:hypothetical protein
MPSRRDEDEILVTVVWCRRAQDEEEEVQHIQMGPVGVDWEFAWSLQQVLGGVCRWLFSLDAWLFRDWRNSGESVRQSPARGWVAAAKILAGCLASRAWLAREESGALLTHFRRSRGARLHRCNSRRKHRCFGSDGRCCCSCARRSTSFPRCRLAFKQRHGRAGVRRRRGMCLGGGQDAVRASRARIGVTCTNRALQRAACSIFPQGSLCGRGVSCCPLLRCWPSAGLLLALC